MTDPSAGREELPAAGWYPDPAGNAEQRYWNGSAWTDGVVRAGRVTEEPLPAEGAAKAWDRWDEIHTDRRAPWPGPAAAMALGGWVVAIVLSIAGALIAVALGFGDLGRLILAQSGLWAGLLLTCRFVSRRYGTGNLVRDYRLVFRWRDAGRGFVLSLAGRMTATLIILPFLLSDRFRHSPDLFSGLERSGPTIVTVVVIAVVGAPLIEELFFRGLLQRSLETVLPLPAAIALQAVLFGAAHFTVEAGISNIPTILAIGSVGAILGYAAARWHRLGPGIVGHALFNLGPMLIFAFGS